MFSQWSSGSQTSVSIRPAGELVETLIAGSRPEFLFQEVGGRGISWELAFLTSSQVLLPCCLLVGPRRDCRRQYAQGRGSTCHTCWGWVRASQVVLVVKNPPANAGDASSFPGSGRSPGGGRSNRSSILAWRMPQTEEPGGP